MTAPPRPGDILLGKYRVDRIIGQGGMGMVIAARHTGLGELFAIKLMLAPEGQAIERFLREARICASLKGDHVVKVQDVGQLDDGRPYMVMEYLQGQDLAQIIEKRGALPISDAGAIVLQTCEALAEAHALGIVHRDIKPANIFLIRKPNGKPSVKLLDFGISKRLNVDTKALTATGAIMGSPLYMSPEQLSDARAVGPQSDIWAMGVVLYELLTARVPFDEEMIFQVIHAILHKEPELPSSISPALPVEVDRIVSRCLRKKPKERYASIPEFAADIREMLRANSVISPGARLFDLSKSEEAEINIAIDVQPLDVFSLAPTVEALPQSDDSAPTSPGAPAPADEPRPTNTATNRAGSTDASGMMKGEPAVTQSPSKTHESEPRQSAHRSPLMLVLAAALLLALGAGSAYLIQGQSRSANGQAVPELGISTAPVAAVSVDKPTPAPEPVASVDAAPLTEAVATSLPTPSESAIAAASAAPSSPYLFPSLFKPRGSSAPPVTSVPKPETSATKKRHEGLY